MTQSKGNLLVYLREGTESEHSRVEKHPLLRQLTAATLTLEQYSRVIAAFIGFYEAHERRMQEIPSGITFPDYHYQPRLSLLIEDLATLPVCIVTPCTVVPEFSCNDELLGVFYVLEGATQGGRVIAPLLRDRLALTDSVGTRFFNFYRQHSWQEFRSMVGHCQPHYDYQLALTAARATFRYLHSHLDHCLYSSGDELLE